MSLFGPIKSVLAGAGHWLQESYCAVAQKVGEQVERISDSLAEKKYLASRHPAQAAPGQSPVRPLIELKDYRVINGHKHAN